MEKFDNLESAHKALKSDHSTLNESHDHLQTQLKRYNVPSTSSPSFGKEDLARSSQHKGKGVIDEILSRQRTNNGKEGLGYIPRQRTRRRRARLLNQRLATLPMTRLIMMVLQGSTILTSNYIVMLMVMFMLVM